jgi:hypothetical protein
MGLLEAKSSLSKTMQASPELLGPPLRTAPLAENQRLIPVDVDGDLRAALLAGDVYPPSAGSSRLALQTLDGFLRSGESIRVASCRALSEVALEPASCQQDIALGTFHSRICTLAKAADLHYCHCFPGRPT